MKIEKLQTIFSDQKIIICMILVIFMFSLMSGCVTEKVDRWAEIKEKDAIEFIKIKNVRAATKQENGDILFCVEFADLGDSKESGYYTILLPISSLTNSDIGKTTHGFKKKSDVIDMLPRNESYYYHPYGWNWYLYPIEMAQKGCDRNFFYCSISISN